jgi:uncharacterized repeat protein (TIGR03803 family)
VSQVEALGSARDCLTGSNLELETSDVRIEGRWLGIKTLDLFVTTWATTLGALSPIRSLAYFQPVSGGLVQAADGNFYGTTSYGGANNYGTVFKITNAGALTSLYSFADTDGSEKRQNEEASAGTVNRELAIVQHMFRLGQRTTPPKTVTIPYFRKLKEAPARQGFLEQGTYDKLREHAGELWLRGLLATAYAFAWRRSELLNLKVSQINLAENSINLGDSKNGDARLIIMTGEVRALLTALVQGKKEDDFVFTREDGKRVKDFRGSWQRMFADAGVPLKLFHDLRRSGVRNMIRSGIYKDTAKRISGHRTDSTFSRYNIVSLTDFEEAAEKIALRAETLRSAAAAQAAAATATKTATPAGGQPDAQGTIQC